MGPPISETDLARAVIASALLAFGLPTLLVLDVLSEAQAIVLAVIAGLSVMAWMLRLLTAHWGVSWFQAAVWAAKPELRPAEVREKDEAAPSGPSTDPPGARGLAGGSLVGVLCAMVAAAAGGSTSAALVAVLCGTAAGTLLARWTRRVLRRSPGGGRRLVAPAVVAGVVLILAGVTGAGWTAGHLAVGLASGAGLAVFVGLLIRFTPR